MSARVQDILNIGMPTLYALLVSGELQGAPRGITAGVWRISEDDLQAYLDAAYRATAEKIAVGDVGEGQGDADD